MPLRRLPVFIITFFGAAALIAQEKLQIRQHWEPGKTYHLELNSEGEIGTLPPGGVDSSTLVVAHVSIAVTQEPSSDRKIVAATYDAVRLLTNDGAHIESFDSENPDASDTGMLDELKNIKGTTVPLVYDKDDNFVDGKVPPHLHMGAEDLTPREFAELLGREIGVPFPGTALAIGESTTFTETLSTLYSGIVKARMKGRIDSVGVREGHRQARILTEGTPIRTGEDDQDRRLSDWKLTREILFDLDRRCMTKCTTRIESEFPKAGGPARVSEHSTTTLKRLESQSK